LATSAAAIGGISLGVNSYLKQGALAKGEQALSENQQSLRVGEDRVKAREAAVTLRVDQLSGLTGNPSSSSLPSYHAGR